MNVADNPHAITGTIHEVGSVDGAQGWVVFTSLTFADDSSLIMQDVGPFPSREAAAICAKMAADAGVEEITPDMVRASRRAYMTRAMK